MTLKEKIQINCVLGVDFKVICMYWICSFLDWDAL